MDAAGKKSKPLRGGSTEMEAPGSDRWQEMWPDLGYCGKNQERQRNVD